MRIPLPRQVAALVPREKSSIFDGGVIGIISALVGGNL